MPDVKISALPASTTPLAGTEVLPIVQSSTTKQVSVANLTAGRTFDALGMTLTSTDAGASAAPLLDLYRDSATPAASDTLGEIEFNGEDSAGNKQTYGLIHASILSPTSTSEQGQLHFETATAGALTEKMIIGTSNLVINEIGSVFNVRIEGDADANLFYTDATNDRVGVGTSSPQALLHVGAVAEAPGFGTAAQMLYVNGTSQPEVLIRETTNDVVLSMYADSNSGSIRTATNHPLVFFTNNTDRMRITSAGNVGIGNATPITASGTPSLTLGSGGSQTPNITFYSETGQGQISFAKGLTSTDPYDGYILYSSTSRYMGFGTAATERMRLDSSGNLLVGTTSGSGNRLDVVGGGVAITASGTLFNLLNLKDSVDQSGATFIQFANSTGGNIGNITRVTTTNAVTYNTTSDYRLKTVTGSVTGQGERIDALKPIDYEWKEGNQQSRGFLAHEFQTIYPNSVSGEKDAIDADGKPVYQGMQASTAEVIADLVAEIQSLRQRIATLENK